MNDDTYYALTVGLLLACVIIMLILTGVMIAP